jgi:hypothetical protein
MTENTVEKYEAWQTIKNSIPDRCSNCYTAKNRGRKLASFVAVGEVTVEQAADFQSQDIGNNCLSGPVFLGSRAGPIQRDCTFRGQPLEIGDVLRLQSTAPEVN